MNNQCLLAPGDSAFRALEFSLLASSKPFEVPDYKALKSVVEIPNAGNTRRARRLLQNMVALSDGLVRFLKKWAPYVRFGEDGIVRILETGQKANKFLRKCRRFQLRVGTRLAQFEDAILKPDWFKWNLREIPILQFALRLEFSFKRLSMSQA
jgi:hypothetical protein